MQFVASKYNQDNYIPLVGIHLILGVVLFVYRPLSTAVLLITVGYFLVRVFSASKKNKTKEVLLASAYFVGVEVLFRMTKAGISYEASKYLVILFMVIGMVYKGVSRKAYPYFIYLLLLLPAIVVAAITLNFDVDFRRNVTFVLSGPICLGIATLFCYDRKVSQRLMMDILLYMALPVISLTTYLFLYSPSVKDILSSTASNSATSGGFGPNQVATALGLGMFIIVVRLFLRSPNLALKLLNMFIFIIMGYRAFVTFSRGGVVTAIIIITIFLWILFFRSKSKRKNQIIGSLVLFGIAAAMVWTISVNQTMGLLEKRYANQTAEGIEKDDIGTGRTAIFIDEMEGFFRKPFFGVGASRTKDRRIEELGDGVPSHNEVSRLLGEHGLFGIVILMILLIKPLLFRVSNRRNIFFYSFLAFWFATINHTGMRIAAPSFIYALALLNVTYDKRPLHRKQLNTPNS